MPKKYFLPLNLAPSQIDRRRFLTVTGADIEEGSSGTFQVDLSNKLAADTLVDLAINNLSTDGNDYNASQSVVENQPIYLSDDGSGKPALQLGNQWLNASDVTSNPCVYTYVKRP